jgi:hypothetical protein
MPRATYVCMAPPLCAPCRVGNHFDCSWDGEPDCLCEECTPEHKAANRAAAEAACPS